MKALTLFLTAVLSMSLPVARRATAQEGRLPEDGCEFEAGGASVVEGMLAATDSTLGVERFIGLQQVDGDERCSVVSDSAGLFSFRPVPPGAYRLSVAPLGLQPFPPIEIAVGSADLVRVDIPVFRENRLADCLEVPACAPVLTRRTSAEAGSSDTRAIEWLALRLAIVMAGEHWRGGPDWVACVSDFDRVGPALNEVFSVVPEGECQVREVEIADWGTTTRARVHVPSGRLAAVVRVGSPRIRGDSATVGLMYVRGPLWGQGHECELRKVRGRWIPVSCRMTMVS